MTAPGWYPDPSGSPQRRYFDGSTWTDQFAPADLGGPPPKKKASRGKIILGVVGVIVLLIIIASVAGGGGDDTDTASATTPAPTGTSAAPPPSAEVAPSPADPPAGGSRITYEVQSDGPLSTVTYFDEINDMQQLSDQPSNWSTSFDGKATFQMHSMSAQTTGTQVSCRITVGGEVLAEESATGRYAVVTCAG